MGTGGGWGGIRFGRIVGLVRLSLSFVPFLSFRFFFSAEGCGVRGLMMG